MKNIVSQLDFLVRMVFHYRQFVKAPQSRVDKLSPEGFPSFPAQLSLNDRGTAKLALLVYEGCSPLLRTLFQILCDTVARLYLMIVNQHHL